MSEQDPEYLDCAGVVALLARKLEDLVRELVRTTGLTVHDVVHRVKVQESAARKLKSVFCGITSFTTEDT